MTLFLMSFLLVSPVSRAAPENAVWVWFTSCGGPTLTVEIVIDKKVVHKASVPICHTDSDTLRARNESRSIAVRLTPSRAIQWTGYRDLPDVTPADRPLTFNLWEAEAGVADLSIGVSVMDKQTNFMNTVHVAHPDRRDETEIAAGVVVVTFPHGAGAKSVKP
ncbi:MAG TPA: hypothetical protein VMQ62_04200 [Dongiaceae bacterium]|nr:hypothetical protein [Dongiaceae bacterium]